MMIRSPMRLATVPLWLCAASLSLLTTTTYAQQTGAQCNWYGHHLPLCKTTPTGWGWEDNASCVATSTCAEQPAPWGIVGQQASSAVSSARSSTAAVSSIASSRVSSSVAR
jgi:hypothetical protein